MGIYGKLILVNKLIFSIVTASVITILFQKKVPSAPRKLLIIRSFLRLRTYMRTPTCSRGSILPYPYKQFYRVFARGGPYACTPAGSFGFGSAGIVALMSVVR